MGDLFAPGAVIAKDYRIERRLAEGGMGALFVVEQLSTGRRRALKILHPALTHDAGALRRFVLEAKIGSRIASEHVVQVHAAGVDEGTRTPYLVMELLEGEDLATRLERGPLTPSEVRELFRQVCHAMIAAHRASIVHRDLKPENIFLSPPRGPTAPFHVKILDFGIAKLATESATYTAGLAGTPMWMAPEQGEPTTLTTAADVWALGLILFKVWTGRAYWRVGNRDDATIQEVLREVLLSPIVAGSARALELGVTFPPALDEVFRACVVRDVAARLPNADAFWRALETRLGLDSLTGVATRTGRSGAPISALPNAHARTASAPPLETPNFASPLPPEAFGPLAPRPVRWAAPRRSSGGWGLAIGVLAVAALPTYYVVQRVQAQADASLAGTLETTEVRVSPEVIGADKVQAAIDAQVPDALACIGREGPATDGAHVSEMIFEVPANSPVHHAEVTWAPDDPHHGSPTAPWERCVTEAVHKGVRDLPWPKHGGHLPMARGSSGIRIVVKTRYTPP